MYVLFNIVVPNLGLLKFQNIETHILVPLVYCLADFFPIKGNALLL
jgi:hypothetical protein